MVQLSLHLAMKLLVAAAVGRIHAAAVSKPVLRGVSIFNNATLGVSYDEDMVQHQVCCWCTRVQVAAGAMERRLSLRNITYHHECLMI